MAESDTVRRARGLLDRALSDYLEPGDHRPRQEPATAPELLTGFLAWLGDDGGRMYLDVLDETDG